MVLMSGQNEVLYCYCLVMLRNNFCFGSSNWRWAPCSLTDSQIHGLIKTGRFFENPLVGRHVEFNFKLIHMAFGYGVRWFVIESPVGRHVLWFKIKYMAYESILSVYFWHFFLEDVRKLTYLWVAVLATTTLGRHVDWKFNHMDWLKPVGFWEPTSWAPCWECKPKKGVSKPWEFKA